MKLLKSIGAAAAGVVFVCSIAGCGDSLSGSSTCAEFMNAPSDQQDQVVNSLATKYHKPDLTSPLGRPAVPYYCASHPQTTLDQFFAAEEG